MSTVKVLFLTQDSRRKIEKEINNAERDKRTLKERIQELKCTWVLTNLTRFLKIYYGYSFNLSVAIQTNILTS